MIIVDDKLKVNNDILNNFEKYMEIMKYTDIGTFEWSKNFGITFSENLEQKFGIKGCSFKMFDIHKFIFREDAVQFVKFIRKIKNGRTIAQVTCRIKEIGEEFIWCKISAVSEFGRGKNIERLFGIIQIIDNEIKMFNKLKHKTEFDEITNIRNFEKFNIDTTEKFKNNPKGKFAIIVMDIDKFKIINDVYGVETGKTVLRQVAIILQRILSDNFVFGRRYTDNFCIAMEYSNEEEINDIIDKIIKEISLSKFIINISPVFGVYIVDDKNSNIEVMCDRANIAKKNYNSADKKTYMFYDTDFRKEILAQTALETEMYNALDNKKFYMYLQPKYDLKNKNIVGAEALVRWNRDKNSFLLPDKFLPLFEKNGFIIKLDEYIWEEACRILRKWIDLEFKPVPISVNVSRRQIFNPNFLDMLLWLTQKYDIPHNLIGLELPEGVFIDNNDTVCGILEKVKKYGFILEMDDFGEGYSSLKMLQNVNVDVIKIDKGFLDKAVTKKGKIVLKHTIIMAKELNLRVIAEGVENKEQIDFLMEYGCDTAQGFYFSKPLSVDEFEYKTFYNVKG